LRVLVVNWGKRTHHEDTKVHEYPGQKSNAERRNRGHWRRDLGYRAGLVPRAVRPFSPALGAQSRAGAGDRAHVREQIILAGIPAPRTCQTILKRDGGSRRVFHYHLRCALSYGARDFSSAEAT